jgi:hypothetical protein
MLRTTAVGVVIIDVNAACPGQTPTTRQRELSSKRVGAHFPETSFPASASHLYHQTACAYAILALREPSYLAPVTMDPANTIDSWIQAYYQPVIQLLENPVGPPKCVPRATDYNVSFVETSI